jgi:uncharacterized protein (TIGR02466 family)
MNIVNVFPTCIGVNYDIDMADRILPIAKKHLENPDNLTNTWKYKTTYYIDGYKVPEELCFFDEYIKKVGNTFLNKMGYSNINNFKSQIFFSEMFEGDAHSIHAHPGCILSGVFYLNVPQGSSNIKFFDPAPYKKSVSIEINDHSNQMCWDWYTIKPEKGMLVIWKSHVEHEVPPNFSQDGRLTVVFNLCI